MTAEGVLRDYATIAAVQFARESQSLLDGHIQSGMAAARQRGDSHVADHAGSRIRDCDCNPPAETETIFVVSATGTVYSEGEPLDATLADALAKEVAPTRSSSMRPASRLLDGHRVLVTAWGRRGVEPVTVGFIARGALLERVFDSVVKKSDLLPGTLVDRAKTREVMTIRVTDAGDRVVYRTDEGWSAYTGAAAFGAHLNELRVAAAIKPEHASALLIDGLPSERWSLVLGLLVLAAGLMTAAAVQLRREIRFARQRADFVSGVSHELRTPLAQIRLFGETLLLGRVRSGDEARHAAEVIVQEARRLGQMVDNVLLFSRVGRGMTSVHREPVHVPAVLAEAVDAFRPQAASKQVSIELDVNPDLASRLVDANALRQVLLNLLDNAVKYGPRGQVIRIRAVADGLFLRLEVTDEGPGVDAADVDRIWEPFWRAAGSVEGGTGLGLAIVRELANGHGGTARLERPASGGAQFVVTFDAPAVRA